MGAVLCLVLMCPVCVFHLWMSGADVSPLVTTITFSALLSPTDLEESSDISGCKECWCEGGNCLRY